MVRGAMCRGMIDPIPFARDIENSRVVGYATDRKKSFHAVPLLNHTNSAVGAISIAGTSPESNTARSGALVTLMLSAGAEISERLGYAQHDTDVDRSGE